MALEGYQILAESLARNGLKYMFGVVGIPVVEVAIAAQRCGIHYIGMRNEQAACYAAQAIGKITAAHLPHNLEPHFNIYVPSSRVSHRITRNLSSGFRTRFVTRPRRNG